MKLLKLASTETTFAGPVLWSLTPLGEGLLLKLRSQQQSSRIVDSEQHERPSGTFENRHLTYSLTIASRFQSLQMLLPSDPQRRKMTILSFFSRSETRVLDLRNTTELVCI